MSSEWLEARVGRDGRTGRFANDPAGIEALAGWCRQAGVGLVAMEATGGYEKRPFALLWGRGIPSAIANPRAVRRFAEGMGLFEKTDRIDAGVIAWYAEVKRLKPCEPASEAQAHLAALVTRLRQLTELRTAQMNQRRLVTDPTVGRGFEEMLGLIARQIGSIETEVAERIAGDPVWRKLDEAFRTIKGVADRTVARLMAELPEIGTLSGKAVAKLVGLAPIANDSGKRTGNRPVRGGRTTVRAVLFVVAEIVRRYVPDFAAFHQRLRDAGKPPKVVRIALAHKLLLRLNAKARDARHQLTAIA